MHYKDLLIKANQPWNLLLPNTYAMRELDQDGPSVGVHYFGRRLWTVSPSDLLQVRYDYPASALPQFLQTRLRALHGIKTKNTYGQAVIWFGNGGKPFLFQKGLILDLASGEPLNPTPLPKPLRPKRIRPIRSCGKREKRP